MTDLAAGPYGCIYSGHTGTDKRANRYGPEGTYIGRYVNDDYGCAGVIFGSDGIHCTRSVFGPDHDGDGAEDLYVFGRTEIRIVVGPGNANEGVRLLLLSIPDVQTILAMFFWRILPECLCVLTVFWWFLRRNGAQKMRKMKRMQWNVAVFAMFLGLVGSVSADVIVGESVTCQENGAARWSGLTPPVVAGRGATGITVWKHDSYGTMGAPRLCVGTAWQGIS